MRPFTFKDLPKSAAYRAKLEQQDIADICKSPAVNKTVLQTIWRRIKRPSRETIRRLTQ